jgi:hypothetical protein
MRKRLQPADGYGGAACSQMPWAPSAMRRRAWACRRCPGERRRPARSSGRIVAVRPGTAVGGQLGELVGVRPELLLEHGVQQPGRGLQGGGHPAGPFWTLILCREPVGYDSTNECLASVLPARSQKSKSRWCSSLGRRMRRPDRGKTRCRTTATAWRQHLHTVSLSQPSLRQEHRVRCKSSLREQQPSPRRPDLPQSHTSNR